MAGENSAAWAKATMSALLLLWLIVVAAVLLFSVIGICTCHNLWGSSRVPFKIVVLLCIIATSFAVKSAEQPASHNCPIDSSEWGFNAGNRCAIFAVHGRVGMLSDVAADDWIVVPSGRLTWMLGTSGMSLCLASFWKKWPVLPVSAMQSVTAKFCVHVCCILLHVCLVLVGEAGFWAIKCLLNFLVVIIRASRVRHVLDGVTVVGVVRPALLNIPTSFLRRWIMLHPPCMLRIVESLRCPSAGNLHFSLVWSEFTPNPWLQQ